MIICAGCKKSFPLSQYVAVRKKLYVFGPDGNGIYEILPFCSKECWDEHPTDTKRRVRELRGRCHNGVQSGEQCPNPGLYTCTFVCCSCRKCADHKTDGMITVADAIGRHLHGAK